MDAGGGNNYQLIGTTQFLSVPYALYAFKSGSNCGYKVGDNVQALGGYIFYLDPSGCHGLVADVTDLGFIPWSLSNTVTKAIADWIVGGRSNTNRIIAVNGFSNSPAADACKASTAHGFTDWYLPSKIELNMMYVNLHLSGLGGFTISTFSYWSSTEQVNYAAWDQNFSNGTYAGDVKTYPNFVRAIRSF